MNRNTWIIVTAFFVLVIIQYASFRSINAELAVLRAEIQGSQPEETAPSGSPDAASAVAARPAQPPLNPGLQSRLGSLERAVSGLQKTSELLMERGLLPPTEDHIAQIQQRFFDTTASDSDRLRALRLLRRNRGIDDTVLAQAVSWLQISTNWGTRRDILRQIDGSTNALLKPPLLAMLQTETSPRVRDQIADVLGGFVDDPAVENTLWELAMNDPSTTVQREAMAALADGEIPPERAERLRQQASAPDASLDQRLLALHGLREANIKAPEVIADMATLAQNSTDPVVRTKLFRAFDGLNDPALMAPLVYGLQDPNPVVRENAADALSSFAGDPRIQEWLNHVIQTDADPRVKREAYAALEQSRRRPR